MRSAPPAPPFPKRFVVVTFIAAAVVGIATLYFGLHGQLGATIP